MRSPRRLGRRFVRRVVAFGMVGIAGAMPSAGFAQTDYYNTDAGRPIRVEDAYSVERRAFEIQLAPVRLERARGGRYQWGVEPELAYGLLPRTHLEVGVPVVYLDGPGGGSAGLGGVDISLFHNLNVETAIPAIGVSVSGLLPVGHLAPEEALASIKGIVTRTFRWARFHLNAEYTFGDGGVESGDDASPGEAETIEGAAIEVPRWMAGLAVDRTFPLRSLLVTAEVFAERPIPDRADVRWNAGAGIRYQLSPRFNIDAGIGRRLSGDDQSWYTTFGAAVAFGLPWRP